MMPVRGPSEGLAPFFQEFEAAATDGSLWHAVWHTFLTGRGAHWQVVEHCLETAVNSGTWFATLWEIANLSERLRNLALLARPGAGPLMLSPTRGSDKRRSLRSTHPGDRGTWNNVTPAFPCSLHRQSSIRYDLVSADSRPSGILVQREAQSLIRAGKECQAGEKRMSRTDALEVMTERFDLSRSAEERLWSTADHHSKEMGGRIPSVERISLKEII